jgi:hypothetical protein
VRPPTAFLFALFASLAGATSCVQIDGGAVEVSWEVHANGRAITDCSCADPAIAKVRIDLVGKGGAIDGATPCAGRTQCEFSCQRKTGATPFDVPETQPGETYLVSVVALDADGHDLPRSIAPPAVERTVTRGQPTEVEAFLLEVGCAASCGGMNSSGVCARH